MKLALFMRYIPMGVLLEYRQQPCSGEESPVEQGAAGMLKGQTPCKQSTATQTETSEWGGKKAVCFVMGALIRSSQAVALK